MCSPFPTRRRPAGSAAAPATTLALNTLFCLLSGFRGRYSLTESVAEAVTAVAMGMVFSAVALWLIGELRFETGPVDILGRILMEAVGVSVGVSFADSQVRGKDRTHPDRPAAAPTEPPERLQFKDDLQDLAATVAGSTLFAMSVAPTEEVVLVAARLGPAQLLVMVAASLGLCYLILFAAGFEERKVYVPSVFQSQLA